MCSGPNEAWGWQGPVSAFPTTSIAIDPLAIEYNVDLIEPPEMSGLEFVLNFSDINMGVGMIGSGTLTVSVSPVTAGFTLEAGPISVPLGEVTIQDNNTVVIDTVVPLLPDYVIPVNIPVHIDFTSPPG